MKYVKAIAAGAIEFDPKALLGISLVVKVSGNFENSDEVGQLLSKVGEGPGPTGPRTARLLSKIGETPG